MSRTHARKSLFLPMSPMLVAICLLGASAAQAAGGALQGETYVFHRGDNLTQVVWGKMTQRHLQDSGLHLYGKNGVLAQIAALNPWIKNGINPGAKIKMPNIPDDSVASNDLTTPAQPAQRAPSSTLPPPADAGGDPAPTERVAAQPPAPSPERPGAPTTVEDTAPPVVATAVVAERRPAAREVTPENDIPAVPQTLAVEPPETVEAPVHVPRAFAPGKVTPVISHHPSRPAEYIPFSFRAPAQVPVISPTGPAMPSSLDPNALDDLEMYRFHWGAWKFTERPTDD